MPSNIELKARLDPLARAEETAEREARFVGSLEQVDTYFATPSESARLKLRETIGAASELIAYARPDGEDARRSDYHRVAFATDTGESLKEALAASLGVRRVVAKRRRLYLLGDVRIHLDHVEGLGDFLEFEAVLDQPGERLDEATARQRLAELAERFGIRDEDRIAKSYGDL